MSKYRGKLKDEDVTQLSVWVGDILAGITTEREDYTRNGLSEKRFRWDVFWAARRNHPDAFNGWIERVYAYADDTHIDTLLRHLVGTP